MNAERTYTIKEVSAGIERALEDAFPESIWVVGEIQGLDRAKHGRHWYFQLCESTEGGEVHRLSSTLWNRVRDRLFAPGGKLSGLMNADEPLDGMKIRALCKLDFYAPFGKISLHVEDIDPAYTLGELEARRQALIEKLTRTGELNNNKSLTMDEVPLRIGLITSQGSAAYNDFMKEMERSGIGFHILLCDARMQGEETLPTVRAAFHALRKRSPDVIVLIRGGGSRLDLSWFDREEVVKNILRCDVPVVTGIGHEIDVTIAEMAAFAGLKTPTAAAAFLVERVKGFLERIFEIGGHVARETLRRVEWEAMDLKHQVGRLTASTQMRIVDSSSALVDAPRRLRALVELLGAREDAALAGWAGRLSAGRHMRLLETARVHLSRAGLRLRHGFSRLSDRESHRLALSIERVKLLDPKRTIERGYALLKNAEGNAIKSVHSMKCKESFTAQLRDGRILALVEGVEEEEAHDEKEKRQLEIW
jgi:exodeoxyribonuclease VII large subunit